MVLYTEGIVAIFLYWLGTLRFICLLCNYQLLSLLAGINKRAFP